MRVPVLLAISGLASTLACGAPVTRCAPTPTPPAVARPDDCVDAFVAKEMARQRVPGVAIAIIRNGEAPKVRGYGVANVEHDVPVTKETIFQSGSIGKQFTAVTVMLLVEDGKIGLGDSIAKYFPEAPAELRAVTVRHLLTHTSGIPDYTETLDYHHDYKEEDLVHIAFSQKLDFPPGTRWSYSNAGYALLGFLVQRAGGAFYGDVLKDRVFGPTGMKTARIISDHDLVPHRAAGYALERGAMKNQDYVSPMLDTTADGSLYFSMTDLVAWDRALRDGAILTPASWAEVYAPVRLASGKTYPYGFGWALQRIRGHAVRRHDGAWQGFKTDILRYPDDGLTVIALCNLADADPERFTDGLVRVVAPDLAAPRAAAIQDRDPDVTARVRRWLDEAARGVLSKEEFAETPAWFFRGGTETFKETLEPLGPATAMVLVDREERGDDVAFTYQVTYGAKVLEVSAVIAPGGTPRVLNIQPVPAE